MNRVTQGGDINFNVADVRGLGDNYAFRFYTTDSDDYIVKVDADAVDDIIRLEWDELKTLGQGVLCYYADNLESDEEYSDGTFNRTFGGTTKWYIVTSIGGGGSSEDISELSDRLDAEIERSTEKDEELEDAIGNTYTKDEVDRKIAKAEMGGELPSGIVIDANYVHTDNNYTTAEKTKLAGLSNYDDTALSDRVTATEHSIEFVINQSIDGLTDDIADLQNGTYRKDETYSQSEVDRKIAEAEMGGELPGGIVIDANYVHTDNNYTTEEKTKLAGLLDVLITDVTHESDVDFVAGKYYKNFYLVNYPNGAYDGGDITDANNYACASVPVKAGDTVRIWVYSVGNTGYPYVYCVGGHVSQLSPKSTNSTGYTKPKSDPWVLEIKEDGIIYINSGKGGDYGCTISNDAREIVKADSTHDGIMTKEQAAQLESVSAEDGDLTILKSYIVDSADVFNAEFVTGKYYRNFGLINYIGQSYQGGDITDASDYACVKVTVKAGDIVTIWCSVTNTGIPYVICDSNNIIKVCSPKSTDSTPYTYTRENPEVLNMTYDGYIYIDALTSAAYGCIVTTPKRAFRNATTEEDGLMPKEIMALFGGDSMSDDQTSLKLKTFAFIGDSFSAGGYWQKTMCNDLGALFSINKAVSGGAWNGTDNLSAYYQAQQLVSSGMQFDYILCVLGTNDVAHWNSYTLGDINFTSQTIGTASGDINPSASITGGIQATLITLKRNFPNAIIKIGYTPAGLIHDAVSSHQNVNALCDRLRELSFIYGVGYLETRDCGICYWLDEDKEIYISGGHPTGDGQTRIGHYMARKMLSNL